LYDPEAIRLLEPHVTNLDDSIYCLRNLPPEVLAVLFAYVSRSPASFRDNLLKLLRDEELALQSGTGWDAMTTERTRKFHEQWVIGYGHGSVAEHADLKYALEDVSIIASKVIEDHRLAGYTEKSTRYQHFSDDRFYFCDEVSTSASGDESRQLVSDLYKLYHSALKPIEQHFRLIMPRGDQSDRAWTNAIHAATLDVIRYLLPAGTMTALGISINAREAAYAVSRFLSHPLAEIRDIGNRMLEEGVKIAPTLLKYARQNEFRVERERLLSEEVGRQPEPSGATGSGVTLLDHDPEGEDRVLAGLLYEQGQHSFEQQLQQVKEMSADHKEKLMASVMTRRGAHDQPSRAFEMTGYTMEMLLDYGAFRDVQRHRIATQLNPLPTVLHGYETPPEFATVGLAEQYHALMKRAAALYHKIATEFPNQATYYIPLAFRKRVLFRWNLRELFHFVELRSAPQGHQSYRLIAQQVYYAVAEVHPLLARFIRVDLNDYTLGRLDEESRGEQE
jgi:thymidylate synthase ThyX